jgi:hypothetical protein
MFLFRNDDGATSFATIDPAISGLDDTGFGRGLIGVDFDNDGDIDVININFETEARVYRNETITKPESVPVDKSYLRVFIDTSKDPGVVAPNGYGVQVVATADNGLVQRVPIATGSNYLSQSELSAHFGLGDATLVTQLVIEWPNGTNSVRKNVAINQTITIEFCRGDWNGDAANNILDFVAYSQAWSSNDPNADLDANGQFNVLDFVAFQTLYVKCAGL